MIMVCSYIAILYSWKILTAPTFKDFVDFLEFYPRVFVKSEELICISIVCYHNLATTVAMTSPCKYVQWPVMSSCRADS